MHVCVHVCFPTLCFSPALVEWMLLSLIVEYIVCRFTESLCSNACLIFSLPLLFYFYFFSLCDVTFSADVLKANPSNLGAQITRVSYSIVSLAIYLFCLCLSFLPLPNSKRFETHFINIR